MSLPNALKIALLFFICTFVTVGNATSTLCKCGTGTCDKEPSQSACQSCVTDGGSSSNNCSCGDWSSGGCSTL